MEVGTFDATSTELILEVVNVTVNSARTQFTINLKFTRNEISTFSKYKELGFNVIFFGSNFGIENNPIQAGFARNSKMVDVNDKQAISSAQFDFASNEGALSPFAYVPTSTNNRCGVSYLNGQAIIEVLGCAKPILLTFVTGFVHKATADTHIDITSYPIKDASITTLPDNTAIVSPLQTLSSSTEYIYQSSASDTVIGPTIMFAAGEDTTNLLLRAQLGLVFIGIKSMTPASYPTGAPESFIIAVGAAGYSLVGTSIDSVTAETLDDGLKSTTSAGTPLDFQRYNKATTTNMGHSFCGFTAITKKTTVRLNQQMTAVGGNPQVLNLGHTGSK